MRVDEPRGDNGRAQIDHLRVGMRGTKRFGAADAHDCPVIEDDGAVADDRTIHPRDPRSTEHRLHGTSPPSSSLSSFATARAFSNRLRASLRTGSKWKPSF